MINHDDAGALYRMGTALVGALRRCACRRASGIPCRECQTSVKVLEDGVKTIDRLASTKLRAVPERRERGH